MKNICVVWEVHIIFRTNNTSKLLSDYTLKMRLKPKIVLYQSPDKLKGKIIPVFVWQFSQIVLLK